MSVLVVLCAASATALFILAGYGIFRRAWAAYEERYVAGARPTLEAVWLSVPPEVLIYCSIASAVLVWVLAVPFLGPAGAVPVGLVGTAVPRILLAWMKRNREQRFALQLVDALANMANALRAGQSLPQAIEMIAREMDNPIRQEFGLAAQEMRVGVPMEEALAHLVERMPSPDLDLVVTSIDISREVGGNLTEVLDNIAGVIRERHRVEGRIRALTAMGRMQGIVMGGLPIAVGLVLHVMRPGYFRPMIADPLGWACMGGIAVMLLLGVFFIWRIVSIDV